MQPTDKQSRANVLEFNQRQEGDIEERLLRWIVGITKSNERLMAALERLRESYIALAMDAPATASSELLLQVERVLSEARKAKTLVMVDPSPAKQGG